VSERKEILPGYSPSKGTGSDAAPRKVGRFGGEGPQEIVWWGRVERKKTVRCTYATGWALVGRDNFKNVTTLKRGG